MNLIGVLFLVCAKVTVTQSQEGSSDKLSIDSTQFQAEVRVQPGYNNTLPLFSLTLQPDKIDHTDFRFMMLVVVPSELLQKGEFYCTSGYFSSIRPLPFTTNEASTVQTSSWSAQGSAASLTDALGSLKFSREANSLDPSAFQVEYLVTEVGSSATRISFIQTLLLPSKLQYKSLPDKQTVMLTPGRAFKWSLVRVEENIDVLTGTSVKSRLSQAANDYFSVKLRDDVVVVEGFAPQKMPANTDALGMVAAFSLIDRGSGRESEEYQFYLQLDSTKVSEQEKLQLILLTAIICSAVLLLFGCVFLVLRREREQQQQQVQAVIQEAVPQENILTRSIMDWHKDDKSTRDQTGLKDKELVLFNPYEKYSLKRRDVSKGEATSGRVPYASLARQDEKGGLPKKRKTGGGKEQEAVEDASRLEMSKAEESDRNQDESRELEFGNLSRIVQDKAPEQESLGEDQNNMKVVSSNIKLEDIMLNER